VADAAAELHSALSSGKTVLAEGAQGTLLDVDFGSYPYVTSSTTTAPGALTGLGLGLDAARDACVVGVVKAFQTRVGSGPFPTEIQGQLADRLRGTGKNPWDEYGTTTGRPRRIGWLDMLLLKYAIRLNGVQELAVTKLDILGGLKTLRLCTRYRKDGHVLNELEFGTTGLESVEPEYEDLPGWDETLSILRSWDDLPKAARAYLDRLAELAGVPVTLVSVGPEREQLITRG
jgi:adenylosuccinate synthase